MTAPPDGERGWERFAASLVGRWAAFATVAPCASIEPAGEATAAIFPAAPTRAIFNNALLPPGATDPAATLPALRRAYARAGVARFALWLRADDRPALDACAAAGWRVADTTVAMIAALPAPTPAPASVAPATPAAAPRIEAVATTAEICALNEVDADLLERWPERTRAYLVRDGAGRPLSAAVAMRQDDDCALGFVATRPDARRQGHGARIVARLLADAATDGCTTATLASTAAAERLYRAFGFRDLCRVVLLQPL
jgi:GNAT superfamily N-acetyltransferase